MSIRPLSKELLQKAIAELNEVPNRRRDDLDHILEWLRKQHYLNARTEEQWLLVFLRSCKFSLQKTKEKLDLYYTMRTISPRYYKDRNPFSAEVQEFCKLNVFAWLPCGSNPLAPRRLFCVARNGDPDKAPVETCLRIGFMITDVFLHSDDAFVINGQEFIFDIKSIAVKYIGQWTPSAVKVVVTFLQHAYPVRFKGAHFINVHPLVHALISTLKSLLSKKLADRIHTYSENDFDSLYKVVPREIFPEEYGGNGGPLRELTEKMRHKLESYSEWLREDMQYSSDESKRPGKPTILNEFFDMEGSFRKLEID